jgi:hypothetical protein
MTNQGCVHSNASLTERKSIMKPVMIYILPTLDKYVNVSQTFYNLANIITADS